MIDHQLFIDGQLADLSEDTNVTLRHESNLLNGGTFTANYSLTVSLPATLHNCTLLGFPGIVQSTVGEVYKWHDVEYHRGGVPVVTGGRGSILKATTDKIEMMMVWGIKRAVDAISGDKKLSDIVTDAAIEFHAVPQVTPYNTAISSSTEIFYAALDTTRYASELEYYHIHVGFANRSWDANSLMGASSYLHPSVRMDWLLGKIEDENGIYFDFDDPNGEISTMIVPLISKIPNDITFNGGYKATVTEPLSWGGVAGNFIRFDTVEPGSPIIATQSNPPEGSLVCATAFKGLLRFSLYLYLDELVTVSYPVFRPKYGYRLDITVHGRTETCVVIPEATTFMANERDGQGRIGFTVSGSIPVNMAINDTLTMRITCISNGVADVDLFGGIHVYGGNIWINDIIGALNEVQPTQMYPVQGNLPDIKLTDLVKFLCAITGAFPVQASTDEVLAFRQVEDVFDFSRADDWSGILLSPTSRPEADETTYTPNGWARQNWWRWKEDETVAGDYDGGITVDDETVDETRDVMTFPFAATDGNNIPMYTTEYKYDSEAQVWSAEVKWHKVEPRVLHMQANADTGDAEAYFGFDMSQVIARYYTGLLSTMEHPVVIRETVKMNDVRFLALDETRPIYLAQHGAYFAMLSCELSQNGTAKVELLKLKKQEET